MNCWLKWIVSNNYTKIEQNSFLCCYQSFQITNRLVRLDQSQQHLTHSIPLKKLKTKCFFPVVSLENSILSLEKKRKVLNFHLKKHLHITFAGKACSVAKENLWRCPLHWYAALGRKTTAVHLHVRKRKLRSSHSKLFEVQPIEFVAHLFGIAMSIFKIMVIQAEIRHFAHTVFIEEDVACGQITMDNLRKSRKLLTLW